MNLPVFLITMVIFLLSVTMSQGMCLRGTYKTRHGSGQHMCKMCEEGKTYMPESDHTMEYCFTCSQIQDPRVEIVVRECNLTHDTDIQCISGYYRQMNICVVCSVCDDSSIPCNNFSDTFCCPKNYEVLEEADDTYTCKERLVLCGRGHYLSTESEMCVSCPPNTYMTSDKHNHTSCLECQTLSNNPASHAMILQPCSSRTPTIFGCEEGYFRDMLQESQVYEATCSKCRTCQRYSLSCHVFHDAICAPDDGSAMPSNDPVSHPQASSIDREQVDTDNITWQGHGSLICKPCKDDKDHITYEDNMKNLLEICLTTIDIYSSQAAIFAVGTIVISVLVVYLVIINSVMFCRYVKQNTPHMDLSHLYYNNMKGTSQYSQTTSEYSSVTSVDVVPTPPCTSEEQKLLTSLPSSSPTLQDVYIV